MWQVWARISKMKSLPITGHVFLPPNHTACIEYRSSRITRRSRQQNPLNSAAGLHH
jgi:hypothetical protein